MSSAGHVFQMIASLRYNNSQRSSYKDRIKKMREALDREYYQTKVSKERVIPKEELARIKEKIRLDIRKEQRSIMIKTIVVFCIVSALFFFFIFQFVIPRILNN